MSVACVDAVFDFLDNAYLIDTLSIIVQPSYVIFTPGCFFLVSLPALTLLNLTTSLSIVSLSDFITPIKVPSCPLVRESGVLML